MDSPSITKEQLEKMTPEEIADLQKKQCIFCQIVAGSIQSYKIHENEECIALLDINPATKGHILIIPKEHIMILPQAPKQVLTSLFNMAQKVSKLLLRGLRLSGTTIFLANGPSAGQKAQHLVLHVIPRREGDGLFRAQEKLLDAQMVEKIKLALQDLIITALEPKKEKQKTLPLAKKEEVVKQETSPETEPLSPEKEKKEVEEDEPVSLDDIASLFK